jgi:hypothetical protein
VVFESGLGKNLGLRQKTLDFNFMILHEKTKELHGIEFDKCKVYDIFHCRCDYCETEFTKSKRNITVCNKIINKDSCGSKECSRKKREESSMKTHGVKNAGYTEESVAKIEQTNIERFGVKNAMHNPVVLEKLKASSLEKYGVETYMGTEEFRKKSRETCLEKYGTEYSSQSPQVKESVKSTCLEKYGSPNYLGSQEGKEAVKKTMSEKYGVENMFQIKEIREKGREAMLSKYGVENAYESESLREKSRLATREKYGSDYVLESETGKTNYKEVCLDRYGVDHPLKSDAVKKKVRNTCIEKYGHPFPAHTHGRSQKEIGDWLMSIGFEFYSDFQILNGKEIDLYNEKLHIGIEYNGCYWHNELSPEPRDKNYHYEKYIQCLNKNIRLISIFDYEWKERNEQCKNYLCSVLGVKSKVIYARKCKVEIIEKLTLNEFCDSNHIQGRPPSIRLGLGLIYDGIIVGCLSLGSHHRNHTANTVVLNRMCFEHRTHIPGGCGKLLSAAKKWASDNKFDKIISWSDNRWSQGNVYKMLGFELEANLNPDYTYFDMKKSKITSKQSQKKSLTGCPKEITEREWCRDRGLGRIWDCGKKRWSLLVDFSRN